MTLSITHTKVSAKADAGDATLVRPSDWNAVHAISGYITPANGGTINVKAYGAVGDGVTDDSAAILAAVNAAASLSVLGAIRGSVFFPAGIYKITADGVLTETNTSYSQGVHYFGEGMSASILRLATVATDRYFYNNVATPRMSGNSFSDLGFEGMDPAGYTTYADIPTYAKGFRVWATAATGSHEQMFHFTRCGFSYLNIVFVADGDETASPNSWVQCEISKIKNTVLSVNNVQAFCHEFINTNITLIYGDTFVVGGDGGGGIKMYGGSIILASGAADSYFVNFTGSTGPGSFPCVFHGLRMELRGDKTKLAYATDFQISDMLFESCNFEDQATVTKTEWVSCGTYTAIKFDKCFFYEFYGSVVEFAVRGGDGYGQAGSIVFHSCRIPVDWSDRCAATNGRGRISALDCYGSNVGAPTNGSHWAHDFDMNWDDTAGVYTAWAGTGGASGSWTDNNRRIKVAAIFVSSDNWPYGAATLEHTLRMPKNAIIKNIHLRKPASGTDTTVCTLKVGRNDKSGTAHLTSDSQQYKLAQTGDVTNYFYHLGSTDNERTLRLYTSVATATEAHQGGFCIVEYL